MKTNFVPLFNMKSASFFRRNDEAFPTKAEILASGDYAIMPAIPATELEEVYEILNIRHPQNHCDMVHLMAQSDPKHEVYKSLHTSLSVGDVIIEYTAEGPVYHFCMNCGWKVLE
jgi:hypothetical protein